jgi:hypothetical protein
MQVPNEASRAVRSSVELRFSVGTMGLVFRIEDGEHQFFLEDVEWHRLGHFDANGMWDVLRWDEVQLLGTALKAETVPHWAIDLLLLPYVALTEDVVEPCAARMLECLRSCGAFGLEECDAIGLAYRNTVRIDARWRLDADWGWVFEGPSAYSTRRVPSDRDAEFPFESWRRLLDCAERASPP